MKNSGYCKLIETLKTFSREEFSDFEKIAASPYFSRGRNYLLYIKALKKYYPEFRGNILSKDNARKQIFRITHPGKTYNPQYMKNIFTGLIHLAEETLYQKAARNYNHQNISSLALEEAKRSLFPLAGHNISALNRKLEENGVDEVYFYCKGMNEIADSVLYNKKHNLNHETGKPFTTGKYFIYFSLLTLALSVYNTSARRAALGLDEDIQFNESFSSMIDLEKFEKLMNESNDENKEQILIFVYYLIHKTRKSGFPIYQKMRNLLFRNYPKLNSRMLFYATSLLFAVIFDIKDKIEDAKFRKEYHKIVLFSLKNRCYKIMKSSAFQFSRFRSAYLNALALGETEWVRKFSDNYINELHEGFRNETMHLINANLQFEKGFYEEALAELRVKCTNIFSKIDRRILKLKILYQKGAYLSAEESIESFGKFVITNNAARKMFRGNFTIFIKYYKKLIAAAEGKIKEPKVIVKELRKMPAFAENQWIIRKFEELCV